MNSTPTGISPVSCYALPETLGPGSYYRLLPIQGDSLFYEERVDRNIGWITEDEQQMLKRSVVGIAGCGGMGGLLGSIMVRLGVGEVRIADSEAFDASNINRQFAAGRTTIGRPKAVETARAIRAISDDSTLVVYPQGITEQTADSFLEGCDVVCDEIEFWAIGARILLHQRARSKGISVFNANTVGFGTRLFFFDHRGSTIEEMLGFSYEDARILEDRIRDGKACGDDIIAVMRSVLGALVPELPEYSADPEAWSTVKNAHHRLFSERRATIIATNPPMATGFLADHVLFHLLRKSPVKRNFRAPVPAPGYLYFDAGFHAAKEVMRGKEA